MADNVWTEIYIPEKLMTPELDLLIADDLTDLNIDERTDVHEFTGFASGGDMDATEEYCRKNDIPYDKFVEGDHESDPHYYYYRPAYDMNVFEYTVSVDRSFQIRVPEVQQIVDDLIADKYGRQETILKLQELVTKFSPVKLPDLSVYNNMRKVGK
jgi:hypothetical protein